MSPNFWDPLLTSVQFHLEQTHVGGGRFYGASHALQIRGRGATSVPQIIVTPTCTHSTRNSKQITQGDQTRCEENFTGLTAPQSQLKFLVRRMLTRDLFAVVNRLVVTQQHFNYTDKT